VNPGGFAIESRRKALPYRRFFVVPGAARVRVAL
jgi:hypothetical protein